MAITCPRCRTRITADAGSVGHATVADAASVGATVRCLQCGARAGVGIVAKAQARPKSTAMAEGFPDIAAPPQDEPQSELDHLTGGLRRRIDADADGPGDEAACRRIGWWLLALRLLPFIVGAVFLLLLPAAVFATFAPLDPETIGLRNLLIFSALIVGPLSLVRGLCGWSCAAIARTTRMHHARRALPWLREVAPGRGGGR